MATYWENSCSFGLRYVAWYECLIVSLVFSHLGFWSGNLFLIAPFPDLCLFVSFSVLYSLDRFFIYTIVSCSSVKNGLIYILYCFMYIYVCDIVCQHETLINYKTLMAMFIHC